MAGACSFQLTGQITWVRDQPPTGSRPYGSVLLRVSVPSQYIGTMCIESHTLFVSVKYNQQDMAKWQFTNVLNSLQPQAYIFMRGALKPRAASADGKYKASMYVEASYRNVKVRDHAYPTRNKVYFDGEAVSIEGSRINAKYSYLVPRENEWKEREYEMIINPDAHVEAQPRDNIFIEGRIFGKNPKGDEQVWILADEVL